MNKLYKKLPLHKTAQNIRLSLHSFVIAGHKERNGDTTYINLKNLQNSRNTFSIQKEPSRFINLFNFLACCPSSKSERVPLFAKKLASLQAATLLHIRAQVNIESAFFTLKSIFIIKKNVFLYAKEHTLIFFCRYLW